MNKFELNEENLTNKISDLVYGLPEKIAELKALFESEKCSEFLDYYEAFTRYMNPSLSETPVNSK